MARQRGVVKFSGKLGDEVYVHSPSYGNYVRQAAKPGGKKNEVPLQLQYRRTAFLNKMASELNNAIQQYAGIFKSGDFYQRLLKQFRKTERDNRIHLLFQVKRMEVNTRYPMERNGVPQVIIKPQKDKLEVELRVTTRPTVSPVLKADCYYYEVLMLTWGADEKPPAHSGQYSDWSSLNGGLPEFVFVFNKAPGTVHWLLAVRIQFGTANKEIEGFTAQGMQIIDAGTLHKKEEEHMQQLEEARKKREQEITAARIQRKAEPVRVKARRVN